jgi:hypothetical protein
MNNAGFPLIMEPNTSGRSSFEGFVSLNWFTLISDGKGILEEYVKPRVKRNAVIFRWNNAL